MLAQDERYLFSVEEWILMAESGALRKAGRVELIDGEVHQMQPVGPPHFGCVNRLNAFLIKALGGNAVVSVQNPVRINHNSAPQPDLAVLHPRRDFYSGAMPKPKDVFLLIEVSQSTYRFDVETKVPRYAMAGIPALWVVDLEGDEILVMTDPGQDGFASTHHALRGETLVVEGLPGLKLDVEEVLGEAD